MLFGTQQLDAFPGKRVDGVFGMWYAKGPGVDRSRRCAALRQHAGTAQARRRAGRCRRRPRRALLNLSAPDRAPLPERLYARAEPGLGAGHLDFGLAGYALSRFCGLWVALKTTAETAEQAATLIVPSRAGFVTPDFALPPHGLNFDPHLRFPADRTELERRVIEERLPAVLAWARANRLDRLMFGSATRRSAW